VAEMTTFTAQALQKMR